jgi:uncharacterized spore protein YtfJ
MKTYSLVGLMMVLLLGVSLAANAQEGIQDSAKFMETLVTQIQTLLKADNVLGTPLDFDGTKIIPVVGYGFGFGAGSGSGGDEKGSGSGAGGGAGGGIMPTSILVITKDGEVQVLTARKGIVSDIMSAVTPIALEAIKAEQKKNEQQQTPPPEQGKN